MKKIILLSLGVILSVLSIAQPTSQTTIVDESDKVNRFLNATGGGRLYTFRQALPEIQGNPYLTEGNIYGDIITKKNISLNNLLFKYNTNEDCIELTKEGRAISIFPHQVKAFRFYDAIEGRKRFFRNGFHNYNDNYTSLTYYEVFYDGETKLLKKFDNPVLRVKSSINVPGVNTNTATKKYVSVKRFYLKKGDKFMVVKMNRSSLKKALNSPEFNAHLKATKNKCRTMEDVQKALTFYDSLKKKTD